MNQAKQRVFVHLDDKPNVVCQACGHEHFEPAFEIKRLSRFETKEGRAQHIARQLFLCKKCGTQLHDAESTIEVQ